MSNIRLGADITTIAKAKVMQVAIEKIYGVKPEMEIQNNKIVLYYPLNSIATAKKAFSDLLNAPDGDVEFKYLPVVAPVLIKQYWKYAALGVASVFFLGYLSSSINHKAKNKKK